MFLQIKVEMREKQDSPGKNNPLLLAIKYEGDNCFKQYCRMRFCYKNLFSTTLPSQKYEKILFLTPFKNIEISVLIKFNCYINYPANIYLFKVNNRNTRKMCKICSKLTIKSPEHQILVKVNVSWVVVFVTWFNFFQYLANNIAGYSTLTILRQYEVTHHHTIPSGNNNCMSSRRLVLCFWFPYKLSFSPAFFFLLL